jgi:hypothetical protein
MPAPDDTVLFAFPDPYFRLLFENSFSFFSLFLLPLCHIFYEFSIISTEYPQDRCEIFNDIEMRSTFLWHKKRVPTENSVRTRLIESFFICKMI